MNVMVVVDPFSGSDLTLVFRALIAELINCTRAPHLAQEIPHAS